MKLAFKEFGSGQPMIILHGLFGSSDNWQTLGKRFAENFKVYLVDQRNHGRSPHSDVFNYDVMARDLKDFVTDHNIEKAIIIGHSMGGKTTMRFAQLFPEKVEKIISVDMGVKAYPSHHEKILEAFKKLNLKAIESRKDADREVAGLIPEFGVRQFILKNLFRKGKSEFGWRVNYSVIEEEMDNILAPLPTQSAAVPALFIYGSKSDYIKEGDKHQIRSIFENAEFTELQAGHWIHAEVPEAFYDEVKKFVTK